MSCSVCCRAEKSLCKSRPDCSISVMRSTTSAMPRRGSESERVSSGSSVVKAPRMSLVIGVSLSVEERASTPEDGGSCRSPELVIQIDFAR